MKKTTHKTITPNPLPTEVPPAPGRPRDEHATHTILHAALALGEERGFDGLTIEGIAARAGVGKTTIYRRWPNVWAIVIDAVFAEATHLSPILELPTARESLAASMKLVARSFRGKYGRLLRPLVGRAQVDPALRQAVSDRWLLPRRAVSREIIRRGIRTGELRPSLDPDTVLDALYGPLYHRLLLPCSGESVDLPDTYIDALIDTVFTGLERKSKSK